MSTTIFLIAHAPLASALRECVLHVFPDAADILLVMDVPAAEVPDVSLAKARVMLGQREPDALLVLTDIFGATPCNIAQRLVQGTNAKLVTGMNLPMLLRAVTYAAEPLDVVVTRAVVGGNQGVMQVAISPPQNQHRRQNDQNYNDHQQ